MSRLNLGPLALAVLLAGAGCSGAGTVVGGGGKLLFPEILIVNDYPRYQVLEVNTESRSGDLMNLVGDYYRNSTAFENDLVNVLLIGQVPIAVLPEVGNAAGQ